MYDIVEKTRHTRLQGCIMLKLKRGRRKKGQNAMWNWEKTTQTIAKYLSVFVLLNKDKTRKSD